MLITNQRIDKLAALRVEFASRGMLEGMGGNGGSVSETEPTARIEPRRVENEEREDSRAVDEPESMAEITLAKTPRVFVYFLVRGLLTPTFNPQAVEYRAIYTSSLST